MTETRLQDGIAADRLPAENLAINFADIHPALDNHEAHVAADRCYFCYDAPCIAACPTEIDIPLFIRQIAADNRLGAAKTIFDQNILGGMCARVCPTETLCEQACVRQEAEGKPVRIGLLQRFATDAAIANDIHFYERAAATGKTIAVVGAGPAGLACAHRLAMHGHEVVIFEAREKPGGLNEYGIATYKTTHGFAQDEVDYILGIGGITVRYGQRMGREFTLGELRGDYDGVFLGMGLGGVNSLHLENNAPHGLEDAVDFIARLRQAADKSSVPIGRKVVVIGGGMTAVDCAVQAKLLGAEEVTIAYRRGQEHMNASLYEQDLAASRGVFIRHWVMPVELVSENGTLTGVTLEYTRLGETRLEGTGERFTLEADQVFTAIGQKLMQSDLNGAADGGDLQIVAGRIATIDAHGTTHMNGVWAGGDCVAGGEDLTVTAAAQGRDAAEAISAHLAN